jgi:hypothetical protein
MTRISDDEVDCKQPSRSTGKIVVGLILTGILLVWGSSAYSSRSFEPRQGTPASQIAAKAIEDGVDRAQLYAMLRKAAETREFQNRCFYTGFYTFFGTYVFSSYDDHPCLDAGEYRAVRNSGTDFYKVVSKSQIVKLDPDQQNRDAEDFIDYPKLIRAFDR